VRQSGKLHDMRAIVATGQTACGDAGAVTRFKFASALVQQLYAGKLWQQV
jgi:hypothetical protein